MPLSAIVFGCCISGAAANVCVNPRIKSAEACGIVLDPSGEILSNALIKLREGDREASGTTDEQGRFRFEGFHGTNVQLSVTAKGFMPAYDFLQVVREPSSKRKKSIYVMLQVGGDGCTMVSLKKSELPISKR